MRWGFRWVTATKGSERERLLASDLSVVRGPKAQWDSYPKLQSPPFFWLPRGVRWDPFALRWSDGSASRPVLTLTRPGNIGLSRELRCRFLRTALAQRITLCSELITFPGFFSTAGHRQELYLRPKRHFACVASLDFAAKGSYPDRRDTPPHRGASIWKGRRR